MPSSSSSKPSPRRIKALAFALLLSAGPLSAALTRKTETTVWDRLMKEQSMREMRDGSILLDEGKYREAVDTFTKAVVSTPDEAVAHMLLGAAFYWAGQVDRAEEEFRQALRLDPGDPQGHQLLGIACVWRDKIDEAFDHFVTAAKLAPARPDVQMNLGSVLEGKGELGSALDRYRLAVGLEPSNPLYRFQLGSLYLRLGREDEGRSQLEAALSQHRSYQDAILELGALAERSGNAKEAGDYYRRAVKNRPSDSVARFRLAALQWKSGQKEEAKKTVAGGLHVTPLGGEGHLELSIAFKAGKKGGSGAGEAAQPSKPEAEEPPPTDPVDTLARNLQRLPADRRVRVEVQMAYLPKTELQVRPKQEAGSSLKRALEGGPRPISVKREFVLPANDPAARAAQLKALAEDLKGVLASRPAGQVHLGLDVKYETPAPEPSEDSGGAKVGYKPRDETNDLGLWVQGTAWMDLVREGLSELPDDAHLVLGLGSLTLGEATDAADEFRSSLSKTPNDPVSKLGLAVALVITGKEDEAKAAFLEVQKLDPKNPAAKQALDWLNKPLEKSAPR